MDYNFRINEVRSQSPGVLTIRGLVVTTTSGTIGSTNIPGGGASVVKTAAEVGRYTVTLSPPTGVAFADLYFLGGYVTVLGLDDTVYTTAKGVVAFFRDNDIATDGTIEIQFGEPQTAMADAELMDGVSFTFCLEIGNRNVI